MNDDQVNQYMHPWVHQTFAQLVADYDDDTIGNGIIDAALAGDKWARAMLCMVASKKIAAQEALPPNLAAYIAGMLEGEFTKIWADRRPERKTGKAGA
jgi:hypothetical protein